MTLICRDIFRELTIHSNGDVVCSPFPPGNRLVLGNIRESRLFGIFLGKRFQSLRKMNLSPDRHGFCQAVSGYCIDREILDQKKDEIDAEPVLEKIRLETVAPSGWKGGDEAPDQLSLDEIRRLLDETRETLRFLWINIRQEPVWEKRLLEILRMARKIVPHIMIYTHVNGADFPPEWMEPVIRENLLERLSFSLDGFSEGKHENSKLAEYVRMALDNMSALASLKDRMKASSPEIVWRYPLYNPAGSQPERDRILKFAGENKLNVEWMFGRKKDVPAPMQKARNAALTDLHLRTLEKNPLVCNEIFSEATILATGDLVCSCIDVLGVGALGNILEQDIYDIFHGDEYTRMRELVLASGRDSYCPWLGCPCAFKNVPRGDLGESSDRLVIKKIRLETISYCNLRCPGCRLVEWYQGKWKKKKHPRLGRLSIDRIARVFEDTRDTLEDIWFYNYGEPFLDKNFLDILRLARKIVPGAFLYTHTNGTVFPEGWAEAIVKEGLLGAISFSIDGATPETYQKYRIKGDFQTAFHNMLEIEKWKRKEKKKFPRVIWQYILFEWNDSPEEIELAQKISREKGIPIQWILTHTEGKSKRFTEDSEEYKSLEGIRHFSSNLLAKRTDRKYTPEGLNDNKD